jgi:8-oxo-dGTP pyrophosphatase MutT (NUDIX family)
MIYRNFPPSFKSYRPQSHKVYGIILRSCDNRLLVVRGTRTGKYSFPKGHINPFESVRDCAAREFHEETGLDISKYEEIGYIRLSAGGYYLFQSEVEDQPAIQANHEISAASWMTIDELRKKDVNIDITMFLRKME